MALDIINKAVRFDTGDRNTNYILVVLAWFANQKTNACWPSIARLTKICHMNKHTVSNCINNLESLGVITKGKTKGGSNKYVFTDEWLQAASGKRDCDIEQLGLAGDQEVGPRGAPEVGPRGAPEVGPRGAPEVGPRGAHEQGSITRKLNKELKDIPPIIPLEGETDGSVREENQSTILAAERCLDFYNNKAGCKCRDATPFINLLTETKSRKGYTEDEVKLVVEWALTQWSSRRGTPKPINICRVTRFDGYLADAEEWRDSTAILDPADVIEAYNSIFNGVLPYAELDSDRERKIRRLAKDMKDKSINGFIAYFQKFKTDAYDFYFGNNNTGWTADIDYLLKPETLRKTRNFP